MTLQPAHNPDSEIDPILARIREGKDGEALALVEALLKREPMHAVAWRLKGVINLRQGNPANAAPCFMKAINLKPDFKEACADLGRTLGTMGQYALAIKAYEHWLRIEQTGGVKRTVPAVSNADMLKTKEWFARGAACLHSGQSDKAAALFRKVLDIRPDMPEALANLGLALHYMRCYAEAEETLLHCLRVKPGFAEAFNILGSNYGATEHRLKAVAAWRQAIAADPELPGARMNLAKELSIIQLYDEAIDMCEHVLQREPGNIDALMALLHMLHIVCRWDRAAEIRERTQKAMLASKQWTESFFVAVHFPKLQRRNSQLYVEQRFHAARPYDPQCPLPAEARGDGKLRIGYLSSDFHGHATAYLISELFERHDRSRFDIYAYSYGLEDNSPARKRIKQSVEKFHDIRLMDEQSAVELIRRDGIDILIDLKGYTTGSRLTLMASRPVPIQMHYLGFPGTTAAPFIDYFITDNIASPPGTDGAFSESLIRLPHSYQINDRSRPLPLDVPPRTSYGLPEKGFVFGAFNNAYKITRDVFSVWMRLLAVIEGSVLWLYETDVEATHNLRLEAEKSGIDPARLIVAKHAPLAEHLARYRHVDLFVDTTPVCGHTTASDALWCGVPVVTMTGECFISRVAASLLHAVGLPELVANGLAEYEALALSLACDKERLAGLHKHLEEGRMRFPLFDSIATTRVLEAAYLHAAQLHKNKQPIQPFTLLPDLLPV